MHRRIRWIAAVGLVLPLLLTACGSDSTSAEEEAGPAVVEPIDGTELSRVTLTDSAIERLDVKTAPVEAGGAGTVVPYAAVFYSPTGETWVYVSEKPATFVREEIVVNRIDGDRAFLSKGPAAGAKVATVGVAELYGAETGLGQ
jgi:hypothetical protein